MVKILKINGAKQVHALHGEKPRGLTEWFDDVNHMLWSSQSPDLNPAETFGGFRTDVLDSALHHHHHNTI